MLPLMHTLAQAPAPPTIAPNASTIFYLTLLFIFLTAIITAVVTKWAKDKCLKFFDGYHVTLERTRGQTTWGKLKVFSSGLEITYDHAYVDVRGRKKTSYMLYQGEVDAQVLSLFRYHDELDEHAQRARKVQVERTFNPGPFRRLMRQVRNLLNTLRDAFNAAIGAVINQAKTTNPASAVLSTQTTQVTQISQNLLGKIAGNAYEPLLEQYIGQPVILDIADPLNPNNVINEFTGYLADYTQQFIAIFNVDHKTGDEMVLTLPDIEQGDPQPALPPPPGIGAPPPVLPPPVREENGIAVRMDGKRMKVRNHRAEPIVIRRLEREGFEPIEFGTVLAPNAMLDLPARDARGGRLFIEIIFCVDVVAPRKFATVHHAGQLVPRRGLTDELAIDQLPLVPKLRNAITSTTERIESAFSPNDDDAPTQRK